MATEASGFLGQLEDEQQETSLSVFVDAMDWAVLF
jgi:hypothetical protein